MRTLIFCILSLCLLLPGRAFASREQLAAQEDNSCALLLASAKSGQPDPQRKEHVAACNRNAAMCAPTAKELHAISGQAAEGLDCGGRQLADAGWSSETMRDGGQILTNRTTGVEVYVSPGGIANSSYDPRTGIQQGLAIPLVKIPRH